MSDTVLSRKASLFPTYTLSSIQSEVDGLVTHFVDEAADPKTLAALTAGGLAYRYGRIGTMALGNGRIAAMPLRLLSLGVGLGAEVTSFEFTNRTLTTVGAILVIAHPSGRSQGSPLQDPSSNLWSWSGPGGWKQALINDTLSFGLLKGAGYLSRESNIVFQHAFSSTAMVAGHQSAALLGIAPKQEGSLAEQLLHAEATNLQLGAGTSLVHSMAPGISALERGLDLSLQTNVGVGLVSTPGNGGHTRPGHRQGPPLQFGPRLALAEGIENEGTGRSPDPRNPRKNPSLILMSENGEPVGGLPGTSTTEKTEEAKPVDPMVGALRLPPQVAELYEDLSLTSKRGAEILLHKIGLPKKYLRDFLIHIGLLVSPEEVEQVLEMVAILHEYNVRGIETGFIPTSRDHKFLSAEKQRFLSTLSEYDEAYWWATHSGEKIRLAPRLSIDWSELKPEEEAFLREEVLKPFEDFDLVDFTHQTQVELDLGIYGTSHLLRRIVEVKRSSRETYDPGPLEEAKIFLQVIRHALLVRQHHLEGVEYVIQAPEVSERFLKRLKEVLNRTGTRYLIWISEGGEKKEIASSHLTALTAHHGEPRKPEKASAPKGANGHKRLALPWTDRMKDFLHSAIEDFTVRNIDGLEEFITQAMKKLRFPGQYPLVEKIEAAIKRNGIPHIVEARKLFDEFKKNRTNTLSRQSILTLVKIVALLTGEPLERISDPPPSSSEPPASDPLLGALLKHRPLLENALKVSLRRFEEALDVVEISLEEKKGIFSEEEIATFQDLLAEATREQPIQGPEGEDWYLPKVLEQMWNYRAVEWDPKLVRRLRTQLKRHEELLHRLENEKDQENDYAAYETFRPDEDWQEVTFDGLPPLSGETLKRYPELELVEDKSLRLQFEGMEAAREDLLTAESRPLLQLLSLLHQYRERLDPSRLEAAENLRLAVLTATEDQSVEKITEEAFQEYNQSLRSDLLAELTFDRVGLFPEIREGGPPLTDLATGFAVQRHLSTRLLPPDLSATWIQISSEIARDPEALRGVLLKSADFYDKNRFRIASLPERKFLEKNGKSDPLELSVLPPPPAEPRGEVQNLSPRWRGLWFFLQTIPEKSSLIVLKNKIETLTQKTAALRKSGWDPRSLEAWTQEQLAEIYEAHRKPLLLHLAKAVGVEELLNSFPEIREQPPDSGRRWGPLPEAPPFRRKGWEVIARMGRQWKKAYGSSLPEDLERILWDFEPPRETEGPEPVEKIAEDLSRRLLQFYFNHREETLLSAAPPPSSRRSLSDEKLWELSWIDAHSKEERLHYLLETAGILSADPLEFDLYYQTTDGRKGRAVVSEKTYRDIQEGKDSAIIPSLGRPLRPSEVYKTVRYHRDFYNMRELLLGMVSRDSRKILDLSKEISEHSRFDPLEKDLHRGALLLALGFDPQWILTQFEKKIVEVYLKNRNKILNDADFSPALEKLPELCDIPRKEWAGLWRDGNLGSHLQQVPSLEGYLRVSALIYRARTPQELRESYALTMRRFKAAEKNSILQRLRSIQRGRPATLSEVDQAISDEYDLLYEESMIAARFYLEHRDEILKSHNLPK